MKAMVLRAFNSDLVLTDLEQPVPGPGEVLIRVKACGICGTDLKIQKGLMGPKVGRPPHVPGHEFAGVVEGIGDGADPGLLGRRVVAYFYVSCGRCRFCRSGQENICDEMVRPGFERDGGYAEYVAISAANVIPFDDSVSFEAAAVLPDAVAVPHHAISTLGELRSGETILIVGVGGLGVHGVQIARALGGRVIACDLEERRLQIALELGADEVVGARDERRVERIMALTDGYGADICVDFVGTIASFDWALGATRKGGRYCLVGYAPNQPLAVDTMPFHLREWRLIGCRGSARHDLQRVVDLTARGLLKPIIDRVYRLEEANLGLADLRSGAIMGRGVLSIP